MNACLAHASSANLILTPFCPAIAILVAESKGEIGMTQITKWFKALVQSIRVAFKSDVSKEQMLGL